MQRRAVVAWAGRSGVATVANARNLVTTPYNCLMLVSVADREQAAEDWPGLAQALAPSIGEKVFLRKNRLCPGGQSSMVPNTV